MWHAGVRASNFMFQDAEMLTTSSSQNKERSNFRKPNFGSFPFVLDPTAERRFAVREDRPPRARTAESTARAPARSEVALHARV